MSSHQYLLGPSDPLEQLFPKPEYAESSLNFKHFTDVICHYTLNSLNADGLGAVSKVEVSKKHDGYWIHLEGPVEENQLITFAERHARIFPLNMRARRFAGWNCSRNWVSGTRWKGTR